MSSSFYSRQSGVAKVVSSSLASIVAVTVFLSELPRYGGIKAVDSPMLMRMEVGDAMLLKDKPLWHSCEEAWVGAPCNATDAVGDERSADVKSNFQLSRFMGEFLGMILATVALISSEKTWRKRGANEKLLTFAGGLFAFHPSSEEETEKNDKEEMQQPEQEQAPPTQGPTQDELDWISSARSGKIRLTEDVYKAALQWWLQQPLADIFDRIAPEDQKLLKPVIDLSSSGHDEEAARLMEQVGRLDRLERGMRRSSAKPAAACTPPSSPLSRSSLDTGERAALMRKAIESHATPVATGPCADEKVPHWHIPQKTNRNRIRLGEHPLAGVKAHYSSRPPSVDSQPLRRSSQDTNHSLYDFGCACGA
jgi:hypothetical protein